jgi:hypothetical protein
MQKSDLSAAALGISELEKAVQGVQSGLQRF